MSFENSQTIATYNMNDHAVGLSEFIHEQTSPQNSLSEMGKRPMIYVMDEAGNRVTMARLQEVTLTDGSKVYNLILTLDG